MMKFTVFVLCFSVAFAEMGFLMNAQGMMDNLLESGPLKDMIDKMQKYGANVKMNANFKQYYYVRNNVCTYLGKNFEPILKLPTVPTNMKNFKTIKMSQKTSVFRNILF